MKILLISLSCLISTSVLAFSCYSPQPIIQKPILFNQERIALTEQYQLEHYGIHSISIEPKIIVLHWTSQTTLTKTFEAFNSPTLSGNHQHRDELPGNLNVSSHYLVDRDGKIYQLMPETIMGRHVIGLNHYAIGIENVGGVHNKEDLTEAQAKANAFLICYLKKKYPAIHRIIGHMDYLKYKKTPEWLEKNPDYHTIKTDPGRQFMDEVKRLVKESL